MAYYLIKFPIADYLVSPLQSGYRGDWSVSVFDVDVDFATGLLGERLNVSPQDNISIELRFEEDSEFGEIGHVVEAAIVVWNMDTSPTEYLAEYIIDDLAAVLSALRINDYLVGTKWLLENAI